MNLTIKIYSRRAIERLLQGNFPKDTAVISFYDSDKLPLDYSTATGRVIYILLDDFQAELPKADKLAEFICKAEADGMDIICQCESGQSRSAGCAAAILEYFYHSGSVVFDNTEYHPDEMVYYSVLEALKRKERSGGSILAVRPSRGVFWLVDGQLLVFPYRDEFHQHGVAKSGNTYNHKLLWEYVKPPKCNKPFDYYPRGRVDFTAKGKPVIYMNANIDVAYIPQIMNEFGLEEYPAIRIDGSDHYKCHLDKES